MDSIAWAAGLFEGEGCVRVYRTEQGGIRTRCAKVAMCDPEPLYRFAEVVGVGKVTGPHQHDNPRWSDYYVWAVQNGPDIRAVGELLYPWLSTRRRTEFAAASVRGQRDKPTIS